MIMNLWEAATWPAADQQQLFRIGGVGGDLPYGWLEKFASIFLRLLRAKKSMNTRS